MNQELIRTPGFPVSSASRAESSNTSTILPRVAVIPAAGRGRRLDRLDTPKPLVEVGGTTLIERQIQLLESRGIERIVVVTGYRGDELHRLLAHQNDRRAELQLVHNQNWQRGLVESLLCSRTLVNEPFLLAMADHIFQPGVLDLLLEEELAPSVLVCALGDSTILQKRQLQSPVLMQVEEQKVVDIGRRLPDGNVVDAGLFLIRPELFEVLEVAARRGATDLCEPLSTLAGAGHIQWCDVSNDGYWFDVDTPSELILAEMRLRQRRPAPPPQPPSHAENAPGADLYQFSTGAPAVTRIVVERGFVASPVGTALIPASSATSPLYLLTDERVYELYGRELVINLRAQGYDVHGIVIPEGETAKTLEQYSRLADRILSEGIDERSLLISLGGGAVCNVCGFLASTLYRGIGLIHIPTTVMAQSDAAISHKQAVNGARGKNMVGSYYPPLKIVVDVDVLATLDDWLVPDGLAEVVKHALAQDADLLEFLLGWKGDIRDPDLLERVIRRNIELKCHLVSQDPQEKRQGLVLHYGHTVGHAIEYLAGYRLGHGECVAIGMMAAAHVARIMECCTEATVEAHRNVIEKFGLPTRIPEDIDIDAIVEMMRYNKRYLAEGTRFALVESVGRLHQVNGEYAIPVSHQILRKALTVTQQTGTAPVYRDGVEP